MRIDGNRTAVGNEKSMTTFFAMVFWIYREFRIDSKSQIYNLDETGFTPSNDLGSGSVNCVISLASSQAISVGARFKYVNRITALHCVSAYGTNVLPALVFKGARLSTVDCDQGKISVKDYIGEDIIVYNRKKLGSSDTPIFIQWCQKFAPMKLSKHGREEYVVLFFDGYRSHLSLQALQVLSVGH